MTAKPPSAPLRTPGLSAIVQPFIDLRVLQSACVHLVDHAARVFAENDVDLLLLLALCLEAEERGHGALDLDALREQVPPHEEASRSRRSAASAVPVAPPADDSPRGGNEDEGPSEAADDPSEGGAEDAAATPDAEAARAAAIAALGWPDTGAAGLRGPLVGPLRASPLTPFVYVERGGQRLLLSRRFADEQERIAAAVADLCRSGNAAVPAIPDAEITERVTELFPDATDSQGAEALRLCLSGRFTIITGGPGSGKTYGILRILISLLRAEPHLRIALAAPTGKAGVRMREALAEALAKWAPDPAARSGADTTLRARITDLRPTTVHGLLHIRPDGTARHTAEEPLPFDVVIVDESSMLDLALLRKLLEAVPPTARLLLLGDRDQLASVEAGSALADLVAPKFETLASGADQPAVSSLAARTVFFGKNHRFKDAPLIGGFAALVQRHPDQTPAAHVQALANAAALLAGDSQQRLKAVNAANEQIRGLNAATANSGKPRAEFKPQAVDRSLRLQAVAPDPRGRQALVAELAQKYRDGYFDVAIGKDATAAKVLARLDEFRVLCTHRSGPLGVSGLNRAIGAALKKQAQEERNGRPLRSAAGVWLGMPVLVTENSADLGLYNGDIGVVLRAGKSGLEVVFPREMMNGTATFLRVAPARLPPWEPAFALTIHKSQGSQYHEVAVFLAGRPSPIETRELLYTGVTRASHTATVYGTIEAVKAALARPVGRVGILRGGAVQQPGEGQHK